MSTITLAAQWFAVWALLCHLSCVSSVPDIPHPEKIERKIAGTVRVGRFVSPYSYEWFIRAELFAARDEDGAAVDAYRKALAGPEEDPLVLARLAEALGRLGEREAAVQVLGRATRIDPDSEAVWLARARNAEREGDVQGALTAYERAQKAAPQSAQAPLAQARLLEKQGANEDARSVLERFAKRAPAHSAAAARARLALAIANGDLTSASKAMASLRYVAPPQAEEVRAVVTLALKYGDFELAAMLLEPLPRAPQDSGLRLRALLGAGRTAAVEALLTTEPAESIGGIIEAAKTYLAIGRPEHALSLAKAALVTGDHGETLRVAAEASLVIGKYSDAAKYFAKITPGAPVFTRSRRGLALARYAASLPKSAVQKLSATAASDPSLTRAAKLEILEALAEMYLWQGAFTNAIETVRLAGTDPLATALRASVFERAGQVAQAVQLYLELQIDAEGLPDNFIARAKAERSVVAGDLNDAVRTLKASTQAHPDDLLGAVRLAELLAKGGDSASARQLAVAALPLVEERPLRDRLRQLLR